MIEDMLTKEEKANRNKLALAALTYEYGCPLIMSDYEFDELSKKIDVMINTGDETLDSFFKEHFQPYTGMWIHDHPYKDQLLKKVQKEE